MARSHLYLPIVSAAGDIISPIVVRLLVPGTTTLITDTVYSGVTGSGAYTPPFLVNSGVVNVYLNAPRRVRLGITPSGQSEFFLDDVDVLPDPGITVYGIGAMAITNSPSAAGQTLIADSATTAHWG